MLQPTNRSFSPNRTAGGGGGPETSSDGVHVAVRVTFVALYSLVFVVGLLLNGVTLKVYFCGRQQTCRSVGVYLKNLAVADFLISLCLPLRVAHLASGSAHVRQAYCSFGAAAFYLNMYASILFMGYIAANRYLKIVHPLGAHVLQTKRAARLVSTATWAFLLLVATAYFLLSLLTAEDVAPGDLGAPTCDPVQSRGFAAFNKVSQCCMAAVFALVLAALLFFYHSTSRRLWRAQRRQPASSGSRRLSRSRRNLLVLMGVFCVCFVPFHLVRLPYAFAGAARSPLLFCLKEVSTLLSVLNACLDPLVFFIFCEAFRAQLNLRGALASYADKQRSSDGRSSDTRAGGAASLELTGPARPPDLRLPPSGRRDEPRPASSADGRDEVARSASDLGTGR